MKIILVSPYNEYLVGGIAKWTRYIINYHREHGGDVELCLLNNENAVQVMPITNLIKRLVLGLSNYLPVYRKFIKKVSNDHYDVVHICTSASFALIRDLLLVRAARKKGVKTIVHMHFGRIPQILETGGWENFLFRRLMMMIDKAVVMDKASLYALKNAGFKNVSLLPNPLSPEVQQIIKKQGDLKRVPGKIVFVGHVCESKGAFELVKACRNIRDIKVELLGKLPSEDIREKLMKDGGKDSEKWLTIPGNMPFESVIESMLTCSVFVLPSYSEGFPNVILESMACGCPIISTPVGAIPEMLDFEGENACGISVPVKDVEALHQAIVDMLSAQANAIKLGMIAKNRVNELYSMPIVWEKLVRIWEQTNQ